MIKPVRVLVVEDSPTQARALVQMLEAERDLDVIATAATATEAIERVAALRPDVVTMDLDIPGGGGQHAIEAIMAETPTPIVVITGLVGDIGAPAAADAISAGALEVIPKPSLWTRETVADLQRRVRRARAVPVIGRRRRQAARPVARAEPQSAVVGIAASTGGPMAVATLAATLRGVTAPLLVVQHIHPTFAHGFASWLETSSGRPVSVAGHKDRLRDGGVYVAPADRHLVLGAERRIEVRTRPAMLHRPSADILFESLAREAGASAVAVVLTGMGSDGAHGALAVRKAGGTVLVQDRDTSVVFGMPQAALAAGAADMAHPLPSLAEAVRATLERME